MKQQDLHYDEIRASYICSGVVAAKIKKLWIPGTKAVGESGDSILINLQKRVFAIADSPDWNKSASSGFLMSFNEWLNTNVLEDYLGRRDGKDNIGAEYLAESINGIIGNVDYFSPTTFSCLIVIPRDNGGSMGLVLHNGDSCIFKIDVKRKCLSLVSQTNFSMIGRTRKLSQVEYVEIGDSTRFVLCSDGIYELTRRNVKLEQLIPDCFAKHELDSIPDILVGGGCECEDSKFNDDISIIALDPTTLSGKNFNNYTLIYNGI
jgi:hypothetical protein